MERAALSSHECRDCAYGCAPATREMADRDRPFRAAADPQGWGGYPRRPQL